ncbi:MAG: argininosuccinate synthase [Lewinellaceae bacterium]|nr:argininosuccinate synthase [Saprospiraceae bacterium]MCB9329880.1 argininosuccinate synthase [Lewinellaceae bacterium]
MKKSKVVLAFSGGLDTSFCAKYLSQDKQMEVHSAIVNTGGFSKTELDGIAARAKSLGVQSHVVLEETEQYYEKIIRYLIYGNVLKNNTYPLSVSAERIYQAIALVEYAKKIGATGIAHGSTGAGNDQVRFDLVFQLLAPQLEIITPIRDLKLSRQEEIDYLAKHGLALDWKKARYSINKGLWGTSVGGAETLTSHQSLPEEAYPSQLKQTAPKVISLQFEKGELKGLNGQAMKPVNAIQALEELASPYAIGRDMHVGDTIIGIKGRVGFEAAAAAIIIKAHHTLEKHTLSKWQLHWKQQLGDWYGMFIHEAQYFEPVMRDIEGFLESTQATVSGTVFVELQPYRFSVQGIESPNDLMQSGFGQYGEMNSGWTGEDVKGFTRIVANSMHIYKHVNDKA